LTRSENSLKIAMSAIVEFTFLFSVHLVRGGRLMVFFLMVQEHRGLTATKKAIQTVHDSHGNSGERNEATTLLNERSRTLEKQFWIWTLSQLRASTSYQKSQLCMWTSFFLKGRGLSWLGMESLADQGIVCGRHALKRWTTGQSSAMKEFCRCVAMN